MNLNPIRRYKKNKNLLALTIDQNGVIIIIVIVVVLESNFGQKYKTERLAKIIIIIIIINNIRNHNP